MFRCRDRVYRLYHIFNRAYRRGDRLEDLPEPHLLPLIALVGRPNVGKSALFNRLVRRRQALVHDTPDGHVTRDYKEGLGQIGDLRFRVADTSGVEPSAPMHSLQGRAAALTQGLLNSSHGVLLLLDAKQGLVPADEQLLHWLQRNCPITPLLVANKADTAAARRSMDQLQADLAALGLALDAAVSATSGEGMADLYQLLQPVVDQAMAAATPADRQQHSVQGVQLAQQQRQQWDGGATSHTQHQPDIPLGIQSSTAPQYTDQQQQDQGMLDTASETLSTAAADEAQIDRLMEQQQLQSTDEDSDSDSAQYLDASTGDDTGIAGAATDVQLPNTDKPPAAVQGPVRLAIIGLPNVGKSTLMNRLLGFERSLTGPEPGLTRDPTSAWLHHAGTQLQLVDTAGWKKATAPYPTRDPTTLPAAAKAKQVRQQSSKQTGTITASSNLLDAGSSEGLKQLADASLALAKRALGAGHVVVMLLDAQRMQATGQALSRLELQLVGLALSEGKALIVAINKADAIPGGPTAAEDLRDQVADLLDSRFLAAGRLPVLCLSAVTGDGTDKVLDAVVEAYSKWNRSISSYKLRSSLAKHGLRLYGTGGSTALLQRIKWAVQLKARPPTFVMLLRGSQEVDEGGQRFLAGVLRQSLKIDGVPVRLYLRYNKRPQQWQVQGTPTRSRPSTKRRRQRR